MFFANNSQSLRVVPLIASIERAACSEPARLTVEIESFNYRRMWPPGKSRLLRRYTLLTTLNSAGISANKQNSRQACLIVRNDCRFWIVSMLKDFLRHLITFFLYLVFGRKKSYTEINLIKWNKKKDCERIYNFKLFCKIKIYFYLCSYDL